MSNQSNWFDDDNDVYEKTPAGDHMATLTNVTLDETKEFPRLSFEFTLLNKSKSWMNLGFKPTQKKFTNWMLRELGIYEATKELTNDRRTPAQAALEASRDIIGKTGEIEITYREWQGKQLANVKVNHFGSSMPTKSKTVEVPTFNDQEEIPF